jgi:hypothetical protein
MATIGRVGWATEEDAREGGAPEGGEEAGVSVTAPPPSACRDIGGHHMPPSLDLAHRWARRLSREEGATVIRRATRCGVLAEVDGGKRWGLGHGATALDRQQSRGARLLKSAEDCSRRLTGRGRGHGRGRGRGTMPLLRIGGDLGRDSRERSRGLLADAGGGGGTYCGLAGAGGGTVMLGGRPCCTLKE